MQGLQALFRGSPEENRADYVANSPIERASKVQAPLLLLQNENAPRILQDALDHYREKLVLPQAVSELYRYPGKDKLDIEQMVEQQAIMLDFARRVFL